jgi:pyruvate-formate lyase-activating enzyme
MNARLLISDDKGRVMEHPYLLATLRSGEELIAAQGRPISLPSAGKLVHLPGRLPVGIHPQTRQMELVRGYQAVGALLPPGYTRTFLPGEVKGDGPILPQWAYTAAAWLDGRAVTWAMHTDRRKHWTPARFSTPEVKKLVKAHRARFPENKVLKQLEVCALVYRCFTSQNVFYARDEGAIPASTFCNAHCVGCISDQPDDGPEASHERMADGPAARDMAEVALWHFEHAPGRTMVSFGQGCEGEPLTRWKIVAEAIQLIRAETQKGSININTNGSLTAGLAALYDAGLDAIRVSLNSACADLYEAYYKPEKYSWADVEASIALSRDRGAYVALNLLLFPGVTDRRGEVDALKRLVKKYKVDQVQTRSLCIDPLQYLEVAHDRGGGGAAIGVQKLMHELLAARPGLVIGNFARGLSERRRTLRHAQREREQARKK